MRGLLVVASAVAFVSATALAAQNPIEVRKYIMQSKAAAGQIGNAMVRGEKDFDADTAEAVLKSLRAGAFAVNAFFPEEPDVGEATRASPRIWENRADFEAKMAEFQQAAHAAVEAEPQDLESFRTAFSSVAQSCRGCHDEYRLERRN
jgi:cytochrome c556